MSLGHLPMPANTKKDLRDKVIMSTLYDGAIRVDELVSLKIRNICQDNENIRLRIHGKGTLLLGHADMKTTRDHYASPSQEQMREIEMKQSQKRSLSDQIMRMK